MPKGGQVHSFYYGDPLFEVLDKMTWKDCISWSATCSGSPVIFCARIGHNIFGPLLQMAFVILVKRTVVGKFKPGPLPRTYLAREWELTRRWIMVRCSHGDSRGALGPGEALRLHHVPLSRAGCNRQTRLLARKRRLRRRRHVRPPRSRRRRRVGIPILGLPRRRHQRRTCEDWPRPERLGQVRALRGSDAARGRVPRLGSVAPRKSRYEVGSIWVGSRKVDPPWHSPWA